MTQEHEEKRVVKIAHKMAHGLFEQAERCLRPQQAIANPLYTETREKHTERG